MLSDLNLATNNVNVKEYKLSEVTIKFESFDLCLFNQDEKEKYLKANVENMELVSYDVV